MTAKMYNEISNAPIEEVLCLATLIATETLPPSCAALEFSKRFFDWGDGCESCCAKDRCLAIIINE